MNNSLDSSIITVTGGTGSFGTTVLRKLLEENVSEIRIFSRDENKQDLMRGSIKDSRIKYIIGDVRDTSSVDIAVKGSDYIFHAAALKQVPSCEFFPMQAISTNIIGSSNVIESALKHEVKGIVCLSSDKAVYPINAMGMSKALMEKVAQSFARNFPDSNTQIAITRYGNVMMSRGSVIPLFLNQIKNEVPVTITNPDMTRFMMSLDDSVNLVKYAFTNAVSGDIFVKKAPACTVLTLATAIARLLGKEKSFKVNNIGIRHGEKLHESLLGTEERSRSINHGEYFRVPLDGRSLDYQLYFDKGQDNASENEAYTSQNTRQLSEDEVINLLSGLPEFDVYRGKTFE